MPAAKNDSIPIVLTHRGYSWYLPYSLCQARASNPRARVLLITDQRPPLPRRFAEIVSLRDHWREAEDFARIYTHLSPNSYNFELFCFQRWFVLNSVMVQLALDRCFFLDSDVLLYSDLTEVDQSYRAVDMTVNFEQGPYSCFINRAATLRDFCDYINLLFRNHTAAMEADYRQWQQAGLHGGISDMHALKHFIRERGIQVMDTSEIVNDATFDTVIHESNGYETRDGQKAVIWRKNIPFVTHLARPKPVRFHTLHMQGNSKASILTHHRLGRFRSLAIGVYNRLRH